MWTNTGLAGVVGVACYFLAVLIPWPETQLGTSTSLLVISGFPILGIIFVYGLYSVVAADGDSASNRLGLVFGVAAFTTLLGMIFAQLAVGAGIGETAKGLDEVTAEALRRGLRLIDLGLDVAWDFLIGTAMVFWGAAMRGRRGLGWRWGIPCAVLGFALIGLNAATFPWPPATRGLFDIGPWIAFLFVGLGVRLMALARHEKG